MRLFLVITILISFCSTGIAQSQDSVKVEIARSIVSKELIHLRDSMNVSLKKYDALINKVRSSKKKKLEIARRELVHYYDLVELDLEEAQTTAQNAWTVDATNRIRTNAFMIRREHTRLRQVL
jgi:hypothetical protein